MNNFVGLTRWDGRKNIYWTLPTHLVLYPKFFCEILGIVPYFMALKWCWKKVCSTPAHGCCNLGTEPNQGKHAIISTGHMLSSAAWKFLLFYTWAEVEKWKNPFLDMSVAQLMSGSSLASLLQSMLVTRLWSLKRHQWWPQYKSTHHLL